MNQMLDKNSAKLLRIFYASLTTWLLLYHDTLWSMVQIWWRSETFAHGFLIFPIAIYLIWDKRSRFFTTEKKPDGVFAGGVMVLVVIWALAKAVDVVVIQQLMVILMLPALVGTVFGLKLFKQYMFPLLYLVFAVPFGEFLIPRLQDFTAIMTVWGLQLSGVPVYNEGMFISIPEGDFEVAVACSGIRYLIASLALGTIYAYLTYTKLYKQIIFVAASLVVPVIANGVRAYGIVMIAHLSDMKYATGVDHLIYGWLFFGVVIFILFYIGSFWQDKPGSEKANAVVSDASISQYHYKAVLPFAIFLLGPAVYMWMSYIPHSNNITLKMPEVFAPWEQSETKQQKWQPEFVNPDSEIQATFENTDNSQTVYYYANEYQFEFQNKELVNAVNRIFRQKHWVLVSSKVFSLKNSELEELIVRNNKEKLLIWNWYKVNGMNLIHPIKIKIAQAAGKLTGLHRGGKFKALATVFYESPEEARKILSQFLEQNPQILTDDQGNRVKK